MEWKISRKKLRERDRNNKRRAKKEIEIRDNKIKIIRKKWKAKYQKRIKDCEERKIERKRENEWKKWQKGRKNLFRKKQRWKKKDKIINL